MEKLNTAQVKALKDMVAYIEFAIEADVPFYSILGTLAHDAGGLFENDDTFLPRSSGYSSNHD